MCVCGGCKMIVKSCQLARKAAVLYQLRPLGSLDESTFHADKRKYLRFLGDVGAGGDGVEYALGDASRAHGDAADLGCRAARVDFDDLGLGANLDPAASQAAQDAGQWGGQGAPVQVGDDLALGDVFPDLAVALEQTAGGGVEIAFAGVSAEFDRFTLQGLGAALADDLPEVFAAPGFDRDLDVFPGVEVGAQPDGECGKLELVFWLDMLAHPGVDQHLGLVTLQQADEVTGQYRNTGAGGQEWFQFLHVVQTLGTQSFQLSTAIKDSVAEGHFAAGGAGMGLVVQDGAVSGLEQMPGDGRADITTATD